MEHFEEQTALAFTLPLTLLRHQRIDIETSQPFHSAPASPVKICYISGYNGMPPPRRNEHNEKE